MATHISDEELTAYLDGEADAALAARIEDAGADIATRLNALRFDTGALRAQADAVLLHAPTLSLSPAPASRGIGMMGAAMAACLAVGLGLGFLASNKTDEQQGWTEYVAAYQALYVEATLAGSTGDATSIAQLSRVLGRDLTPAVGSPDLDFRRAQQLGFNGKPLIQIAYLADGGAPMALCIIKKTGDSSPISQSVLEGMQAASWSDGEFAYLLIGGDDAELVKRSAAYFAAQL